MDLLRDCVKRLSFIWPLWVPYLLATVASEHWGDLLPLVEETGVDSVTL